MSVYIEGERERDRGTLAWNSVTVFSQESRFKIDLFGVLNLKFMRVAITDKWMTFKTDLR